MDKTLREVLETTQKIVPEFDMRLGQLNEEDHRVFIPPISSWYLYIDAMLSICDQIMGRLEELPDIPEVEEIYTRGSDLLCLVGAFKAFCCCTVDRLKQEEEIHEERLRKYRKDF